MQTFIRSGPYVTPRALAAAFEIAIGVGIAAYFGYHLFLLYSPPFLIVANPERDIIIKDASFALSGRTQKESHVFVNDREIAVADDGAFSDTLVLQEGMNILEIKSVNKFKRETSQVRRIIKE
ncbi:hypothetical protein HY250_03250 [Candidatus Azambacteria bacterium]|nr:hypothetical protein [Candidatus Azambacteria bacterium]